MCGGEESATVWGGKAKMCGGEESATVWGGRAKMCVREEGTRQRERWGLKLRWRGRGGEYGFDPLTGRKSSLALHAAVVVRANGREGGAKRGGGRRAKGGGARGG
eukprot:364681-Chlamydomonas_euryale.AAC.11